VPSINELSRLPESAASPFPATRGEDEND
jgi:hypothetical protein